MACFRVRGSADAAEAAKAHPVPRPHIGLSQRARKANSAAPRERNGLLGTVALMRFIAGRWCRVDHGRGRQRRYGRRWIRRNGFRWRRFMIRGESVVRSWYGLVGV
eukprot:3911623-Pleurochrysis_carterae.AAC.1